MGKMTSFLKKVLVSDYLTSPPKGSLAISQLHAGTDSPTRKTKPPQGWELAAAKQPKRPFRSSANTLHCRGHCRKDGITQATIWSGHWGLMTVPSLTALEVDLSFPRPSLSWAHIQTHSKYDYFLKWDESRWPAFLKNTPTHNI